MTQNADEIYDTIKALPPSERLRLVEKIAHDLLAEPPAGGERYDWTLLAGAAPELLRDEDAQSWVSRSRSEADDARAHPARRRR